MAKIVQSVTELIGDTPLVRLNRVVPEGQRGNLRKTGVSKPGRKRKGPDCHQHDRRAEQEGNSSRATRSSNRRAATRESVWLWSLRPKDTERSWSCRKR